MEKRGHKTRRSHLQCLQNPLRERLQLPSLLLAPNQVKRKKVEADHIIFQDKKEHKNKTGEATNINQNSYCDWKLPYIKRQNDFP